jgi:hypothetical protein
VLAGEDAAVAVRGVLAQAQIGDHDGFVAQLFLQRGQPPLHDPVRVPCLRPGVVLGRGDAEKDHARDAAVGELARFLDKGLERVLAVARH